MKYLYLIPALTLVFSHLILSGRNRPSADQERAINSIPKPEMPILSVVYQNPGPVITVQHSGATDNKSMIYETIGTWALKMKQPEF
jgi:hypothetical protein